MSIIRKYGNTIYNMSKYSKIELNNHKIHLYSNSQNIIGNLAWISSDDSYSTIKFESIETAKKEFDLIYDLMR